MSKYKDYFKNVINSMDKDFLWTTDNNETYIEQLIENEIKPTHFLYQKKFIPIASCKNKNDVLGYYEENGKDVIVAIHFMGYVSTDKENPTFDIFENICIACIKIVDVYNNLYKNSRYPIMLNGERIKGEKTTTTLRGFYNILPIIYDSLWKINEFRGEYANANEIQLLKIQDLFQFFIAEFPYKIRDIFILAEIGNYSDACILLRSLIETFIYFKYYIINADGDNLSRYIRRDKEYKIQIKTIMENVVPGFYDNEYAELCKFTHGNPLIHGLFRGNVDKEHPLRYSIYGINLDWYSYIANLTTPIIMGMFNMFDRVYKKNTVHVYKPLVDEINIVKEFILSDMDERFIKYPKQKETIERYKKIVEF